MSVIRNTAQTLRTHWKKSLFAFGLCGYGIKYSINRYEENTLRRIYCAEAKKHGEEKIPLAEKPRRVTVFLNPAAQAGKARKLFEKNAAPILYLAGIEVNVIKTEYVGQIKKFIEVLQSGETDAIVVAGGDGSVLEAVTGILRKEDKKFHSIPVGVIPLGYTNTFARLLYGVDKDTVRTIADAAMAVVKSVTKRVDILKIDGGEGKTTFALCGMEMGAFRDAEERKSKYWYFGPLKSRMTYIRTALMDWPPSLRADIRYVEATEQNMQLVESISQEVRKPTSWNFFGFLFRRRTQDPPEAPDKEDQIKNESEESVTRSVSTVELTLMSPSMLPNPNFPAIGVGIGPSNPTKSELISEGWKRIQNKVPNYGAENDEKILVKNISIKLDEKDKKSPQWYNIDGETFEAIPVNVSLLRNKLNVFYPVFDPSSKLELKT